MFLTFLHLGLWALWYIRSYVDIQARPDRQQVPVYATGSIGDSIGFSIAVYAAAPVLTISNSYAIIISAAAGASVSLVLHYYWRKQAVWQIGSMYRTPSGTPTLAAYAHNLYVWFVATVIISYVLVGHLSGIWINSGLFLTGITFYSMTAAIDRYRGII